MGSYNITYYQIKGEFDRGETHESKLRYRLKVLVKKFVENAEESSSKMKEIISLLLTMEKLGR